MRGEGQQTDLKRFAIVISFDRRQIISEGNLKHQEWRGNRNSKYLDKYTFLFFGSFKYVIWIKANITFSVSEVFNAHRCNTLDNY